MLAGDEVDVDVRRQLPPPPVPRRRDRERRLGRSEQGDPAVAAGPPVRRPRTPRPSTPSGRGAPPRRAGRGTGSRGRADPGPTGAPAHGSTPRSRPAGAP